MNKDDWNKVLSIHSKAIWFLALVLLGCLLLSLWETTHPEIRCGFDCSDCTKDIKNVSQGGIDVTFLMTKLEDIEEIRTFCFEKGYAKGNGIQSGNTVTCFRYENGETIQKSFNIIDDYAQYLIKKYGEG